MQTFMTTLPSSPVDYDDVTLRPSALMRSRSEPLTLLSPPSNTLSLGKDLPGTPESVTTLIPRPDELDEGGQQQQQRPTSQTSSVSSVMSEGEAYGGLERPTSPSGKTSLRRPRRPVPAVPRTTEASPDTPLARPSPSVQQRSNSAAATMASQLLSEALSGPQIIQRKSSLSSRPSLASLSSIPERSASFPTSPPALPPTALSGVFMTRSGSGSPASSAMPHCAMPPDFDAYTTFSIASTSSRNSASVPGSSTFGSHTRDSIASSSHTADTDYSSPFTPDEEKARLADELSGPPSPNDVGLGISADFAIHPDGLNTSLTESPAQVSRVRSRSRSSSAAAERIRWSGGGRWSSRTSSVSYMDKVIRCTPGADVSDLFVPADTTHLVLAGAERGVEVLLQRILPTSADSLLVLDLSRTGLTAVPEAVAMCSRLQELALSGNVLEGGVLPAEVAKLRHLRVLAADGCQLHKLASSLISLSELHTLSIRYNAFRSLPAWICHLTALEKLMLDGNCFAPHWQSLLRPIMTATPSLHSFTLSSLAPPSSSSSINTFDDRPSPIDPYMHAPSPPPRRIRTSNPTAYSPTLGSESQMMKRMRSTGDLRNPYPSLATAMSRSGSANEMQSAGGDSFLETISTLNSVISFAGTSPPVTSASEPESMANEMGVASNGKKRGFFQSLRKTSINKMRERPTLSADTRSVSMPEAGAESKASGSRFLSAASMRRNRTVSSGTSGGSAPPPEPVRQPPLPPSTISTVNNMSRTSSRSSRKSFLKLDDIPSAALVSVIAVGDDEREVLGDDALPSPTRDPKAGLRLVMAYLRDLDDLGPTPEVVASLAKHSSSPPSSTSSANAFSSSRASTPSYRSDAASLAASTSAKQTYYGSRAAVDPNLSSDVEIRGAVDITEIKLKDDVVKREWVILEIISTERSYVKGLEELVEIYVEPASATQSGEAVVPVTERRAVFSNVENILHFHKSVFLPDIEAAAAALSSTRQSSATSSSSTSASSTLARSVAEAVASVFIRHAAFLKMYSEYITGFDQAVTRFQSWTAGSEPPTKGSNSSASSLPAADAASPTLSPSQRKRVKAYLKQCRANPKHTQLNCESYLLLPVQRIPRYKMLLESLLACTPADDLPGMPLGPHPILSTALELASVLANDMNERKRESEGRRKLLNWQSRIGTTRFRSPLVQPHRTLVREGPMQLSRVVKRATAYAESSATVALLPDKHPTLVQVPSLQIKSEGKPLIALLCSDILVLVHDSHSTSGPVDLYTVFRPSLGRAQPASHFGGEGMLRIVDSRAILYLKCASDADAEAWATTINTQLSHL